MIKVVIIEEGSAIRKEFSYLMQRDQDLELVGWSDNVTDGVKLLRRRKFHIVMVDIQLCDGTAFDLFNQLEKVPQNIIFISGCKDFAIKAIKFGALDYLLKPIDQHELSEAINRYRRRKERKPNCMLKRSLTRQVLPDTDLPKSIYLYSVKNNRVIEVNDIMYCKGDGPYTHIYLQNGKCELACKPLKYFEELLATPFFLRTHQSYLVNNKYIIGISLSKWLVLRNNDKIPISLRRNKIILEQVSLLSL